jgi:hypothetical protein
MLDLLAQQVILDLREILEPPDLQDKLEAQVSLVLLALRDYKVKQALQVMLDLLVKSVLQGPLEQRGPQDKLEIQDLRETLDLLAQQAILGLREILEPLVLLDKSEIQDQLARQDYKVKQVPQVIRDL